jgi:hypothetical protein
MGWLLEPAPATAPVAATLFTVPLRHAFPFLAIGANGFALLDRFVLRGCGYAVNDGQYLGGTTIRAGGGFRYSFVFPSRRFIAARRHGYFCLI